MLVRERQLLATTDDRRRAIDRALLDARQHASYDDVAAEVVKALGRFDARASPDADGKVVQYEWYFGDGSMGSGATHRYLFGGSYTATLIVRDTQGGVAVTTKTITTDGSAPECGNGEVRACYSGGDGTQDVGLCIAGQQGCFSGAWRWYAAPVVARGGSRRDP